MARMASFYRLVYCYGFHDVATDSELLYQHLDVTLSRRVRMCRRFPFQASAKVSSWMLLDELYS